MISNRAAKAARAARRLALCGTALFAIAATPAYSAGTQAGTQIQNTAKATFTRPGGGTGEVDSNTHTVLVDELLGVTVVSADPTDVSAIPNTGGNVLTFTVRNVGNGSEAFRIETANGGTDDFDPTVNSIVFDSNNNGTYEPGIDTQTYTLNVNNPVLAPDASVTVFVLSTIPTAAADTERGIVELVAHAVTGYGTAGTTFPGAGTGGTNAVVGMTTARADDDGAYVVSNAVVSLVKTATVLDPFGGTTSVPNSVITYTLTANVAGSGSVSNMVISDAIPTGSTYVPGSMMLDAATLTDQSSDDAGTYTAGTGVAVTIGTLNAGDSRAVRFKVKIN
jgi:uncharacterized repeat protein (TIGR01451 family)